jgi:serine phosphatase RsbU (regulator of sigma subunit)
MLGAFAAVELHRGRSVARTGDSLVIYSDGVTEAASASGDEFGEARLERVVRSRQGQPPHRWWMRSSMQWPLSAADRAATMSP